MASDRQQFEEGSTDDYGSELNTSPTDELAAVSALARSAGELMIIQTLHRFIGPVLIPILKPLIREIVTEQLGLAKLELLARMKENPANEASTSVPKRLKLLFRNRISLPVYTGKRLSGENGSTIEIVLVDALTEQIVNTGIESTAKLEIVGFRVGDDDGWTFEDFQERILSEKKGKSILQGDTCLQLKEGVCSLSKISFTHNSENTKNGLYRLGAGVVDAALMNRVEVARTEAFLMKDGRTTYYEKHLHPCLLDKVCHLQHISYKGTRYKRLKDEGVFAVKDFLTLLYTDPKRLQDILKLTASSNIWNDIVSNAQASNGMFLYLDPSTQGKTGVVLNSKLQLKGLIEEPHKYIPAEQLSTKQKVDNKELVVFASQHFKMLHSFEDETCLKKHLISCSFSLPSPNQSLGTSNVNDGPRLTRNGASEYERGKAIVHVDNEKTYSGNHHEEDMSALESPITEQHAHNPTEPGTSFQDVESPVHTCEHMNNSTVLGQCMDCLFNDPNFLENIHDFLNHDSLNFNSNSDVMMVTTQTVSICTIERARTRWTKVSKLLRRNSVRERIISLTEGMQALKKQRCC
ncbi:hypothetical protein Lser_V15G17208 [Lactuca serriola]